LNIVYHDRILPPLNKERDFANTKDDSTWQIIPIAFAEPVKRKSPSGEVLTYDGHINTCVMQKMKESSKKFQQVLHYLMQKFQSHIKDKFLIHKNSLKLIKRKYKSGKGGTSVIPPPWVI
jgi:hypothetical protein